MERTAFARNSGTAAGPELWARLQWDSDLWIIASGVRMAQPTFPFCEAAPALLGDGLGIAYRVPAVDVPAALDELSRGDKRNRSLALQEIAAETPSGPITGLIVAKHVHDLGHRKAA